MRNKKGKKGMPVRHCDVFAVVPKGRRGPSFGEPAERQGREQCSLFCAMCDVMRGPASASTLPPASARPEHTLDTADVARARTTPSCDGSCAASLQGVSRR